MKRRLSLFLMTILIIFGTSTGFIINGVAAGNNYQATVDRLAKLGVVKVNSFKPGAYITKEEFAKLLILLTNNNNLANQYKKTVMFADTNFGKDFSGYVNASIKKGYLTSAADGKFHPKDKVSFSIVSTAIVKALGYTDADLSGQWPQNYIDKAKSIGVTEGLSLKSTDNVKWSDIITISDRAITTKVKKASPNDADKTLAESCDYFGEYSILNTPKKSTKLDENQILTDKGIIYSGAFKGKLDIAGRYRLHVNADGVITKIYDQVKSISSVVVYSSTGLNITYKNDLGNNYSLNLSPKTTVYFNDTKQNIDNVPNILKKSQTIYFAYNDSGIGVDYAIIISPTDSTLGTYSEQAIINTSDTSAKLSANQVQTDTNIYYLGAGVKKPELGVKYGFYVNNDTIVKLLDPLNSVGKKVKVESISGNILSYSDEKGDSVTYILPQKTLYYYNGNKINYDNLATIIKPGQTVIFVNNGDKSGYEYAVIIDPKEYTVGTYTEAYVINLPATNSAIGTNQVQLDSGIYYLPVGSQKLDIGGKYTFIINGDKIVTILNRLNITKSITVNSAKDNTVWYKENDMLQSLNLSDKAIYYYNSTKTNLSSIKNSITINSSIILSYNDTQSGLAMVTLYDPVYSNPAIAFNIGVSSKEVGNISIDGKNIIKDGIKISAADIPDYSVVYRVSDIWGGNDYVLVVSNYLDGLVTAITPNVLSPKSLTMGGKTYTVSDDFDPSRFSNLSYLIDNETQARLVFGYDGNVVAVYSDQISIDADTNYAMVVNSSNATPTIAADMGKTIFNVKLMCFDGTTNTYISEYNGLYSKGQLVSYKKLDDTHVSITPVIQESWKTEATIHKQDYRMGSNYVSKAIRIFNLLPTNSGDTNIQMLNWRDMPEDVNISSKIQFALSTGSFNDYYILVVNDLFNTMDKFAYVKSFTSSGNGKNIIYRHDLLIDGKVVSFSSSEQLTMGTTYKVKWYGGSAYTISTDTVNSVTSSIISAVDSRRIKFNDRILLLKNDVQFYYKDAADNITSIPFSDVKTGSYSNVTAYLDSSDGKVSIVFITK